MAAVLSCAFVHPCSGSEWQLTEDPGNCYAPEWCENGQITFSSDRYGAAADIWGMDEAGEATNSWRITQNPANYDYEPCWNSACTHTYFSGGTGGDRNIYYINASGSPYQPILVSLTEGDSEAPHATAGGVVFHSNRAGNDDIMWMPPGGESASTYLTTNVAEDRFPCLSPNDSLVAFASNRSGNWDIWLMHAAGESRGVWQLTDDPADESDPEFSPAGNLVAFHRDGAGLMCIDVVTRIEHQITSNPTDTQPCWKPDGTELAFVRQSGDFHIWATDNVPDSAVQSVTWGCIKALYR